MTNETIKMMLEAMIKETSAETVVDCLQKVCQTRADRLDETPGIPQVDGSSWSLYHVMATNYNVLASQLEACKQTATGICRTQLLDSEGVGN